MARKNAKSVETKIRRLTREIEEIDAFFYQTNKTDDRFLYLGMLERKRDDMVRCVVLQLHTAIEDILTSWMTSRVLGVPYEDRKRRGTTSARAMRRLLFGAGSLGFDMKLNLAVALRLINSKTQKQLMELNTLRNRCSHNWLLKAPVRHGRRPRQLKPPLLLYHGRDLHQVSALRELTAEYGPLYAKLFVKALG
jgi:hypothetical protein